MPALEASPALHQTVVSGRREPAAGIVVIDLYAPELARAARPGQFVMALPPAGERLATALGIYQAQAESIALMLVVVGSRTRELAELRAGDVLDLLGPLGNGFDLDALGDGEIAVVAGGVGSASLLLPVSELTRRGKRVSVYFGARSSAALVDVDRFERAGARVLPATDDGSCGRRGFVTELLREDIARYGAILACGPTPMLRAVASIASAAGVRAQLSLEETFACGVGACWGCIVPLDPASAQAPPFPEAPKDEARRHIHARICKEGPVFWAHELRW